MKQAPAPAKKSPAARPAAMPRANAVPDRDRAATDALLKVLRSPRYPEADRKRLCQLVLVTLVPPGHLAKLPRKMKRMLGELSRASKADRTRSSKDAVRALQQHFAQAPPSEEILREFNTVLATLLRRADAAVRKSQTAQLEAPAAAAIGPPPPVRSTPPQGPGALASRLLTPTSQAKNAALASQMAAHRRFR